MRGRPTDASHGSSHVLTFVVAVFQHCLSLLSRKHERLGVCVLLERGPESGLFQLSEVLTPSRSPGSQLAIDQWNRQR